MAISIDHSIDEFYCDGDLCEEDKGNSSRIILEKEILILILRSFYFADCYVEWQIKAITNSHFNNILMLFG